MMIEIFQYLMNFSHFVFLLLLQEGKYDACQGVSDFQENKRKFILKIE
jgi:hypothetical protein